MGDHTAKNHIRSRQPDAGARIRITLHDENTALRPIGEAFADTAIDAQSIVIQSFHDRYAASAGAFGNSILGAAFDHQISAIRGPGGETIPSN